MWENNQPHSTHSILDFFQVKSQDLFGDLLSKTSNWEHSLCQNHLGPPYCGCQLAPGDQGGRFGVTFLGTTIFVWKFPCKGQPSSWTTDLPWTYILYWGKEQLTRSANVVRELFTKQVQKDVAPEIALAILRFKNNSNVWYNHGSSPVPCFGTTTLFHQY